LRRKERDYSATLRRKEDSPQEPKPEYEFLSGFRGFQKIKMFLSIKQPHDLIGDSLVCVGAEYLSHHVNELQGAAVGYAVENAVGVLACIKNAFFPEDRQML